MKKKKEQEEQEKITLARWLIDLINTDGWRCGTTGGERHPEITQEVLDRIGRRELLEQARELERAFGKLPEPKPFFKVDWREFGMDIKKIDISVDAMEELFRIEGIENPKTAWERRVQEVKFWKDRAEVPWLFPYYDHLLDRLKRGELPKDTEDVNLFRCLNAASAEKEAVWERVFSTAVLHESKLFHNEYKDRIVSILKKCSPKADEEMSEGEVLAEHGILTYSQTLELKGAVAYTLCGQVIHTDAMRFGTVLNAQTLTASVPVGASGINKVMTIENKANYESMQFRADTLYIFCHGFFAPKERRFLGQLFPLLGENTEYFHWGDMDYGGIRIYKFIKKELFPALPYKHLHPSYRAAAPGIVPF